MSAKLSSYALVITTAVALPGCPLLDVQAEVPEVCLSYPGIQVDAASPGTGTIDQSVAFDDLNAIHQLASVDASLEFVRARVTALSGITDFSFVDAARLTIASGDPGSTLPVLDVYDCAGDCLPQGTSLDVPAAAQRDALAYAQGHSVIVGIELTGKVPTTAWSMDLDVCLRGSAEYKLQP